MDDRRRFERIDVPQSSRLFALDENGNKLGKLKILGRGGMLFISSIPFKPGSKHTLQISDEVEGIVRPVQAVIRYHTFEGVGCEFEKLDTDAAVEIGVWIGRFYASAE
jgi:hypothetical protein